MQQHRTPNRRGQRNSSARARKHTDYPVLYCDAPVRASGAVLPDIRAPLLGGQFLTGGSGCDCGQLGAGIDERA